VTRFVDVHVHPPASVLAADGFRPYLAGSDVPDGPAGFDELADYYRQRDGIALVHGFDAGTALGSPAISNQRLADSIAPFSDVLVGLGSVDPHRGEAAVVAAHDVLRMGLRGLFFHPPAQQFDPSGRRYAPLWEMAEQLQLPVVVHCGATNLGAGVSGGAGIVLADADPLKMDRVAARHPDLPIALTGVTPPWEVAAIMVATHKPNVHLVPSGNPPDEAGPALREALAGPLTAKTMMGSGFPFATPDRWLEGWEGLRLPADVDRAVLVGNATALFRL